MTNQIDSRSARSIESWKDLAYGPGVWNLKPPSKRECSPQGRLKRKLLQYLGSVNRPRISLSLKKKLSSWHNRCDWKSELWAYDNPIAPTTSSQHHWWAKLHTTQSCDFSAFYSRSFTWHHMDCHIFPISGHENPFHLRFANLFFHHFAKLCLDRGKRSHGCLRLLPHAKHMPPCTIEIYQKEIFYIVPQKIHP